MKGWLLALTLFTSGDAAMASDERGIDETIKPRMIAGSCALALRALEPWDAQAPGVVELELQVGVDGRVEKVKLLASSGSAAADAKLQKDVLDCRYTPATQNRVPVVFILPAKFRASAK